MYHWYKIAFFDETPEAETISVDYIIFQFLKKLTLFV
jgi:hypothetical protein